MSQDQNSASGQKSQAENKATSLKRAYHTPAAPQEFGQLRTLTLGGIPYTPGDLGTFSAGAP